MTVNELLSLCLPLVSGILLGGVFFGGLWWTVRRGLSSPRPAAWFLASQLLRTAITVAGFYLVGRGHWERLLVCLVGFLIARLIVTAVTRGGVSPQPGVNLRATRRSDADAQEANHAS